MFWGIIDTLLWISAIVLFICAWFIPSFTCFLIGLVCLLAAVVILCILMGKGALDPVSDIFDIFD